LAKSKKGTSSSSENKIGVEMYHRIRLIYREALCYNSKLKKEELGDDICSIRMITREGDSYYIRIKPKFLDIIRSLSV